MTANSKLSLRRVTKTFSLRKVRNGFASTEFTVLKKLDLDVRRGEFLAIIGPSGSGKSTLLDLLAGLTLPTSGEILHDGQPVLGPGLDRSVVFQQYALFPWRTAIGNIEFGLEAKGIRSRKERQERARECLDLVGLASFHDRYPHELSGGMKQRVAIARSLSYDPGVLLMDEPFAALDAQTRERLQTELLRIWEKTGKTIVFITHSIDEAVYLGQRAAVLAGRPGRIDHLINIPLSGRIDDKHDIRSQPDFVRLRHELWDLFRHATESDVDTQEPSLAYARVA